MPIAAPLPALVPAPNDTKSGAVYQRYFPLYFPTKIPFEFSFSHFNSFDFLNHYHWQILHLREVTFFLI